MTKRIRLVKDRRVKLRLNFDPVKHPRNPETGQFVERPYPVPDDISGMSTSDIVQELSAMNPDFEEKAQGVAVDVSEGEGSATPTNISDLIQSADTPDSDANFGDFEGDQFNVNAWSASLAQTSLNRMVHDEDMEDRYGDVREKMSNLHSAGDWSDGSATVKLTDTETNRIEEALREYKEVVDRVVDRGQEQTLMLRNPEQTQRRVQTAIVEFANA